MKNKFIATILCFVSGSLYAQGYQSGTVVQIQTGQGYSTDGVYALVTISNSRTNPASCATDNRWAINPAKEWGKALLTLLLTAQTIGKSVEVWGTGGCEVMGTGSANKWEDISYMRLK